MTIAKSNPKALLVGLLILGALAIYAMVSLSLSFTPSRPSITLGTTTQTQSRTDSGNGPPQVSQSSQSPVDAGQQPPAQSVGQSGRGIQGFADAGPDVVATSAPQTVTMCGPKPCPRP